MASNGGLINYLHRQKLAKEQGLPTPQAHSMPAQMGAHPIEHMSAPHSFGSPPASSFSHPAVPAQAPISGALPNATTHPNIVTNLPGSQPGMQPMGQIKLPKLKKMMNLPQ